MQEANGVLVPGLQLLAVNDEPILNDSLTEAREKLNRASFPLRLRVYAVHVTGNRWRSPLFSEPQTAVGIKLDLNHLGHVRLGGVDTHRGRFRGATGLSTGMILTNVNGQVVSCVGSNHKDHDTYAKNTRWIRQRLFERLSPPLFAPPPYVVALDVSIEFQMALQDEVTCSPIPESGLPSSLQSMTYKLERMATITTSNTTSRRARRIKSLPPRIPSTISETTINEDDPYPCLEPAMVPTTTTTATATITDTQTVRRRNSICAQPQAFHQPASMGTTSTTKTTTTTEKDNSLWSSAVRLKSTPKRPVNKMDRLKKPTFSKADDRLIDPTLDDDDESTVGQDLVASDRLDNNHDNTNNDPDALLDSLPAPDEHDEIFEDAPSIDGDEIRLVDVSFTDEVPSFSKHRDSVVVRIHGSHRSLHSGDLIQPGLSGRSLLMDDANEGGVGSENDHGSSWVEEDLTLESTHQALTTTCDESSPPAAVTVPALSPVGNKVGVQVISTHREGDLLTIHLHKTSTHPRLGLILRQDYDASTAAGSGIIIHRILKGGLFGDASVLKPGQIIQQIQDRPTPRSTSKTFELLASLTGRFSIQVKIPS